MHANTHSPSRLGKFLESEESDKLYRETWGEILSILRKHVPEGTI